MRKVLIPVAALALAGCLPPLTDQQSAGLRTAAFAQLEMWRTAYPNAGFINDPVMRLSIVSACALGSTIVTVIDPTVPTMPDRLRAWCAGIVEATTPELAMPTE